MKKILALILSFMLILPCFAIGSFAEESLIEVVVDGSMVEFDAAPFIDENDRTLVPVRALCVALGIADENITFDAGNVSITGEANGAPCTIKLTIGSNIAEVNGTEETLDTAAQIVSDRTFVPLRFVSETFNCSVLFYGASPAYPNRSLIDIKSPAYTKFLVYTTKAAVDEGAEKLLEIAAAITGIHNVSCIIGNNDVPTEQMDLALLAGEPVIIMDTGYITDEKIKVLSDAGLLAKLDDAIESYAPNALDWINSSEEVKALVTDADGSIIAFPVQRGDKIERMFISSTANIDKAVSLIHGYREVVKSLADAAMAE